MAEVLYAQQSIGFNHFFRGNITNKLDKLAHPNLSTYSVTTQIVSLLVQEFLVLWEIQNSYVYGQDSTLHHKKVRLLAELCKVYKYKEIILVKDRDIFYECPEQHIEAH